MPKSRNRENAPALYKALKRIAAIDIDRLDTNDAEHDALYDAIEIARETLAKIQDEPHGFVVVDNGRQRLLAEGSDLNFDSVTLQTKRAGLWTETLHWTADEWRSAGMEAFEAILGIINKIATGHFIEKPETTTPNGREGPPNDA